MAVSEYFELFDEAVVWVDLRSAFIERLLD